MQIVSAENIKSLFDLSEQTAAVSFVEDMIREQAWAAAVISRRLLLSRVQDFCQPVLSVEKETINQTIDSMLQKGDLLAGNGGYLSSAPLRIIECGNQFYRVFGTLPGKFIIKTVGKSFDNKNRIIRDSGKELVDNLLDEFKGILLTPERWACLDRNCNVEEFLQSLDERLASDAESVFLSAYETVDDWQALIPGNGKDIRRSWKKVKESETGFLWRGWTQYRKPVFAWTAGAVPVAAKWLRLGNDGAKRASFALYAKAGIEIDFFCKSESELYRLEVDEFIPLAEYRYLLALTEPEKAETTHFYYSRDNLTRIKDALQKYLNIKVIIEEGAKT
ncbi:MAG: hypothetical protein AB1403_06160 [Candidatus Riflebacteria bacterium]